MKNTTRKLISFILICTLVSSIAFTMGISKASAGESATISIGSATTTVGDEISININIRSSKELIAADFWISYDDSVLKYTGSTDDRGKAHVLMSDGNSTTITFNALNPGNSDISIYGKPILVVHFDEDPQITYNTGSVTVNAPVSYSTDNTLSSLSISPGVLSPAFSPNTTEYTTSVGVDCDKLTVSAIANDPNASVSVTGTRMDPGNNTTKIIVTAQNGSKKTYTIKTTKDSKTTTEEIKSEAQNQNPDGNVQSPEKPNTDSLNVKVNDAAYKITNDFASYPLPSGYEAVNYNYNGMDIQAGKGVNTKLILMYLENTDGKGTTGFYVYDSVAKTFTLYNEVSQPNLTYVILPITDAMEKPQGYSLTGYTINDKNATVLMAPSGEFCLFYGVSSAGVTGWFRYDCKDGTIQAYHDGDLAANAVIASENNNLSQLKLWKMITYCLGGLGVILLVIILILAKKLSTNKKTFVKAIKNNYGSAEHFMNDYEEDEDEDLEDEDSNDLLDDNDEYDDDLNVAATREDEDEMVAHITKALSKDSEPKSKDYEFLDIEDVDDK